MRATTFTRTWRWRRRSAVALERLCRYILRPPLAVKRLERLPGGRVRVGTKRIWSDGTGAVEFTVLELSSRPDGKLAAIIPPPRANQVLYSGVLAGNAGRRKELVPNVPTSESAKAKARVSLKLVKRRKEGATTGEDTLGCQAPPAWDHPRATI